MNARRHPDTYMRFRRLYETPQGYGRPTAAEIADIYASDIVFRDPVHTLNGLLALQAYFAGLYANLDRCAFEFCDEIVTAEMAHVTWNMEFSHRRIAKGRPVSVRGMSFIRMQDDRIVYHEDCYDLGAMLYEHLPLLGKPTRWLKQRLGH